MLQAIEVRNFQSLGHVSLELSRFTCIVGASSSGKSALTRALRTLVSNARGSSFITHGERACTIKATTDRGMVTLKRGKGTEDNEYVLTPIEGEQHAYTKLAGAVPEEVSTFLGIPAKDPLNFAGQFDRPYLLSDSGGEVARVLGALTNVNVIFEGAREANRRRAGANSTLKMRQADLATILAKAEQYRGLKAQQGALERAEQSLEQVRTIEADLAVLKRHVEQVEIAERVLSHHEAALNIPVPDATPAIEAHGRYQAFLALWSLLKQQAKDLREWSAAIERTSTEEQQLEQEYIALLRAAGTCPTCGSDTSNLKEHSHA